jgi:hypothetical protein
VSVSAGTIFQDGKLPLTVWFRAMGQVTGRKNGISALGLQRVLGLGNRNHRCLSNRRSSHMDRAISGEEHEILAV